MEFKGICESLDRIVVSDPSYGDDIYCRYERNDIHGKGWKVQGFVNDYSNNIDGYDVCGVEFIIGLSAPDEHLNLHEDGSFAHYERNSVREFTIGMDTACVGLGVNEMADEIKARRDEWQPDCCLKTLSDGLFGSVHEGSFEGQVRFLVLSGYLDEDTGYSKDDILNYLVSSMNIVLDKALGIDEVLSEAKNKSGSGNVNKGVADKGEVDLS